VRRTQLYLEDDLWKALHVQAQQSGATVSALVRDAVRDRYLAMSHRRKEAMNAFMGVWKDRKDLADPERYIRRLRKGRRLARLSR